MPRYLQVKQLLADRIRYGRYMAGARIPGERELAKEFQVSQMTVNKAILALVDNGFLHREQGKGTFVRGDYRITGSSVMTVGVVVPISADHVIEDFYLGSLFRGMQRAVANAPVNLSILEAMRDIGERLAEAPLDGILFVGVSERDRDTVRDLYRAGKRVVALGARWDDMEAPFVDSDNHYGARCAVEHLIGLGHERIAGVFALLNSSNTRDRIEAFQDTKLRHDLSISAELLVTDEDVVPIAAAGRQLSRAARQQIRGLLTGPDRATAIFCGGYYLALDVIKTIKEAGLRVPEDVSVVGFDDPISASHLTPPLTTVRQPLDEMGRRAMAILVEWFQTGAVSMRGEVLATSLVERESTASYRQLL